MTISPRRWPARRHDLDLVRVVAVATVVLYHVGLLHAAYPAPIGAPVPLPGLALFMAATHPWRMPLLFLISGAVGRHLVRAGGTGTFLHRRLARLVPPLVFGLVVLMPTQYYVALSRSAPETTFWSVWTGYLNLDDWLPIPGAADLPTDLSHLWFLAYLALYAVVVGLALRLRPGAVATLSARLERIPGWLILAGPLAVLIALRCGVFPRIPEATGIYDDVYRHAVFLGLFVLGFLAASADRIWDELAARRWWTLAAALAAFAVFGTLTLTDGRGDGALAERLHPVLHAVRPVQVWMAICAALGFARRHAPRGGPVLAHLTGAVMTIYLVHPLACLLVRGVIPEAWPDAARASALVLGTFAACLAAHEVVRRVPLLRYWFGMGPEARGTAPRAAAPDRPGVPAGMPASAAG